MECEGNRGQIMVSAVPISTKSEKQTNHGHPMAAATVSGAAHGWPVVAPFPFYPENFLNMISD